MITRRDIFVALIAISSTLCVIAAAAVQKSSRLQTSVFDWDSVPAKPTEVGAVRSFFRTPTATLEELELHVTTLNPRQASKPPHKHPTEELEIIKEATLEA